MDPLVLEAAKLGLTFFIGITPSGNPCLVSFWDGCYAVDDLILTGGVKFCPRPLMPLKQRVSAEDALKEVGEGIFGAHTRAWRRYYPD